MLGRKKGRVKQPGNTKEKVEKKENDFKEHVKVIYLLIYFMTSVKRGVTKKRHKSHDTAVILQKSIIEKDFTPQKKKSK